MRYVSVPKDLSFSEIESSEFCFSPGKYVRFIPPRRARSSDFVPLDRLVRVREERISPQKGDVYRYAEIRDIDVATGGIIFHELPGFRLPTDRPAVAKQGDVLVSTVRTYRKGIGFVTEEGTNLVTTNAVLNFCGVTDYVPHIDLPYVYAFLRSDFFVEQVWSMLNRGLYPRMDKDALDKILIPIASTPAVVKYLSALTQAGIEKEHAIRRRHHELMSAIGTELTANRIETPFQYSLPRSGDIRATLRLDSGLYCRRYKEFQHTIEDYRFGATTLSKLGVKSRRGPNLAVSVIGKSLYSDVCKPGMYQLILPTNITEYGTFTHLQWLGNRKRLPTVNSGEIVFGCEATWRSLVVCEQYTKCTTNFHGTVLYWPDAELEAVIWLRCLLEYMRAIGVLAPVAVGGQGGHLSPEYFEYLLFPRFPEDVMAAIAEKYHNGGPVATTSPTLANFVEWHRERNAHLGIWQLDKEMKALQRRAAEVGETVIAGTEADLDIDLTCGITTR